MKAKKTLKDYISNIPKGVKSAVAGLGLLAMVSTANLQPLNAEEVFSKENKDGYRIEATVDVIPFNLQVQGLEETMGASGEIYGEWVGGPEPILNYGTELNPIKISPTAGTFNISKTLIKPQISLYTPSNVGFHINAWQFSGGDLKNGEVSGLSDTRNSGIVSMWDEIFFSYGRESESTYNESTGMRTYDWEYLDMGEELKTKYECSRDFKLLNTNLFASIPVVPTIRAFGGLNFNLFEINDMQRVQSIIYNDQHDLYQEADSYSISDVTINNNRTLEVNSKIKGQGLGPIIGLSGEKNITDWLRVYGDFSKLWVRLKTQRNANFSSIDNIAGNYIQQEYDAGDNPIGEPSTGEIIQYTEKNFPLTIEQTHNVSQTELNLGLEFLLGKHVTLSAGYWKNIMQSLPKPAKFHYDTYYSVNNPNLDKAWEYEVKAKDVSAQGFTIGIGVKY